MNPPWAATKEMPTTSQFTILSILLTQFARLGDSRKQCSQVDGDPWRLYVGQPRAFLRLVRSPSIRGAPREREKLGKILKPGYRVVSFCRCFALPRSGQDSETGSSQRESWAIMRF